MSYTYPKRHVVGCCCSVCSYCHLKYESYHHSDYQGNDSTYDCFFEQCLIPGYGSIPPKKSYAADEAKRQKYVEWWWDRTEAERREHLELVLERIRTGDDCMGMKEFRMSRQNIPDFSGVDECIEALRAENKQYEEARKQAEFAHRARKKAIILEYSEKYRDVFGPYFEEWLEKKARDRNERI